MNSRDSHECDGAVTPQAAAVAAQLARILASAGFANAPSLRRLLSHIVESRLRDAACSLKEYALGVEVFGRGAGFDPATDTIVRVHARRLRTRLQAYYAADGRDDPVRIDVPKGHYEPVFTTAATAAKPRPPASSGSHAGSTEPCRTAPRLPALRNALVGREPELAQVIAQLQRPPVRLLTLTGAGGSGKTRLALQAAWDTAALFPGGVRFVDLAPVADPDTVVSVLARELGVRQTGGRPLREAVVAHLRDTVGAPTLLLLDNLEHLLPVAAFLGELLDACAPLKLLATSRVPLHLYGEHEYPLAPLALPDLSDLPDARDLARVPAVALFLRRAASVNATVPLAGADGRAIAELVCRLDGLPLAIELAAPHARALSPVQMLERFRAGLALPESSCTDVPERQRTLRRTIDWSHQLLAPREQVLLRRLSVFAGGFSLEGASAIAEVADGGHAGVAAGVAALADSSLLHVCVGEDGPRFCMLDSIRQYARERLAASGEEPLLLRALAAWCLVIAEEGDAAGADHDAWLQRCDREHDNIRLALDTLLATGEVDWALRMTLALFPYWERREHLGEARQRLQAVIGAAGEAGDAAARVRARNYLGALEALLGDYDASDRCQSLALAQARAAGDLLGQAASLNALATNAMFQQRNEDADGYLAACVALCRQLANPGQLAGALSNRAKCRLALGDTDAARAMLDEARTFFQALGDRNGLAWCDNHLGDIALAADDSAGAEHLYRQAVEAFTQLGNDWGVARSLTDLGQLLLRNGKVEPARALFLQALGIFTELDHKRGVSRLLEGCACVAACAGENERAIVLAGAAEAVRRSTGMVARPADRVLLERSLAPARGVHAGAQHDALRQRGLGMDYRQAIRYALHPHP